MIIFKVESLLCKFFTISIIPAINVLCFSHLSNLRLRYQWFSYCCYISYVVYNSYLFPGFLIDRYRVAFFAVYDGHGGARASRFASQNLHKFLLDKFPKGNVPHPPLSKKILFRFIACNSASDLCYEKLFNKKQTTVDCIIYT